MIDTRSSWQRLEPHSRNEDFSTGVKATVHDPLWMLTRQWQLGEFEGEDSGSPMYVKVDYRYGNISSLLTRNNDKSIDYDDNIPMEVYVERTRLEVTTNTTKGNKEPQLDLQMQVRLGLQFQREMDIHLQGLLDPSEIQKFKRFLAQDPALGFEENNEKPNEFEMEITKDFLSIIQGRVINIYGATRLDALTAINDKTIQYFANNPDLPHSSKVIEAMNLSFDNLKNWWYGNRTASTGAERDEPFFEFPPKNFTAWNSEQLEYDFSLQISSKDSSKKLILDASNYTEDHLDWYSFTVSPESTANFELPHKSESDLPIERYPIATNLRFSGMPEKRWWNFEDSYVNFGLINPKLNNLATILLMEFALVYSPDWYVIPHQTAVGTVNKIVKLTVVDCFGEESQIEPAGHTKSELDMTTIDKSWDSWAMFTLSEKYKDRDQQHYTPYFLSPPNIDYVLTGTPLEQIKMLRDESANLVWAVENTYRTSYGDPISGYDHSVLLEKKLEDQLPPNGTEDNSDKPLKYTLMTSVPRNWIPFIPVHTTTEITTAPLDPFIKRIKLQRASMVNPFDGNRIRPNSRLLNEVQTPYYINEEEIPRTGIILSESFQRTIWHTGEVFLWLGRKKYHGTGEGSSGLQFDSISLKKSL